MKVVSLFDSQAAASQATEALSQANFGDVDVEVIDTYSSDTADTEQYDYVPTVDLTVGSAAAPASAAVSLADPARGLGLSDDEVRFFSRGVERGGVLVVAKVDDEQAPAVRRVLQENGGRTARD